MDKKAARRRLLRQSENPYATCYYLSLEERDLAAAASPSAASKSKSESLSKQDFISEARRILGQYVPAVEGQALAGAFRAFVLRNQNSSGTRRYRLIQALGRYDLGTAGLRSQFNRGSEQFSLDKLLKIERDCE